MYVVVIIVVVVVVYSPIFLSTGTFIRSIWKHVNFQPHNTAIVCYYV